MPKTLSRYQSSAAVFLGLVLVFNITGCATRTNYVKESGNYEVDSAQCKEEELNAINKNGDLDKPNELNTPKSLQYVSPFESCMVSKGWHPEKTEFRLNSLKMSW
jgi:hypothetical protein